ncbi:MAG: GNAT family N-acetyltransferase [Anaerolineae bacterium]|nr:GNAT family N-acetyltransferase [Anaerolineae bacterium]
MFKDCHIETGRLIIRALTMDDLEDVVAKWRGDGSAISREEAKRQIERALENYRRNTPGKIVHLVLAITVRESGEFIGWCGLDPKEYDPMVYELFYMIVPEYRQIGLATEAVRAMLRYSFCAIGVGQIVGNVGVDNVASLRVQTKAGMVQRERNEDGSYTFSLTRGEYFENKANRSS